MVLLVFSVSAAVPSQSPYVKNRRWRTYRNANYNFSLRYPAHGWSKYEGFDQNGVSLRPLDKSRFHLPPEIGVGGAVGQPSDADETRSRNLEEDFQFGLDALKEYGHARNLVVLSKASTTIQGRRAIVSTTRYEHSSTGYIWFHKEILIHTEDDSPTYHLELYCSPDDAPVLVPLFDNISKTFRILGPPA